MTDPSFVEFYNKLGLREYPFAHWSAEQEAVRQQELFIKPSHYGPIEEKFRSGAGMFLIGERGTGKTATRFDLMRGAGKKVVVVEIRPRGQSV